MSDVFHIRYRRASPLELIFRAAVAVSANVAALACAAAAFALSVAGAAVPSAVFVARRPCFGQTARALCPAASGASAALSAAARTTCSAASDISGPAWHLRYSEEPDARFVEDHSDAPDAPHRPPVDSAAEYKPLPL